ncbi:MAG: F0F1 ATP synthase subunit epsilon [Gammaproteobacteria bacterium]|nr:F0F1 ATP synthase subunit epsilon [Gammaproteobacteria bacterium]MDE0252051.1 F0F1 ATP synthase subunit epsilon [Gammaproteobacteria bacterium]MDE0402840.1 F0F1 ATP synthase subunit epsilon [Gammaproteobacteria bacterium]MDE0645632.1 F0F1 ATP synthase subunit epsilon [Gammaproteobacteria bacterium]
MTSTMHCDIVNAEEEIFSGLVQMIVANGSDGQLGIYPGHAPLLTGLNPGPVRLRLEDGTEELFFASGGFLEVQPNGVIVLADTAIRAHDLDEAKAKENQERAQRLMDEQTSEIDFARASALLADALAQQQTLEELKKHKR